MENVWFEKNLCSYLTTEVESDLRVECGYENKCAYEIRKTIVNLFTLLK